MRCAIYTRKSTDEGLDQEFNSLDAQREAAVSYIHSQRHEGWTFLPDRYDDGGFTGANLDRPGLEELMTDIRRGRIDCVVVYKVDRLSRSLRDFVKLMAEFEQHDVTFVSVTQQFNTTTSMGRLTLNILLSFAQFERELISERTRDKIAYARRNGKWGGGRAALGYRVAAEGGRLEPDTEVAEYVQTVFATYLSTGSIRRTSRQVKAQYPERSAVTPSRVQHLLRNPIYRGMITHREAVYEGEHEALIDADTWERTQKMLDANCLNTSRRRQRFDSLLQDVLVCGVCGTSMRHSTTPKGPSVYRYYTCRSADRHAGEICAGQNVPAAALESFLLRQLQTMVKSYGADQHFAEHILAEIPSRIALQSVLHDWSRFSPTQKRLVFELLVEEIRYCGQDEVLQFRYRDTTDAWGIRLDEKTYSVRFHFKCGRHGKKRIVTGPPPILPPEMKGRVPSPARLLAIAIQLDEQRRLGNVRTQSEIAELGSITRARISQIMSLLNLAPAIQEQILLSPRVLSGRDPFVLKDLLPICREPDWALQWQLWEDLSNRKQPLSSIETEVRVNLPEVCAVDDGLCGR